MERWESVYASTHLDGLACERIDWTGCAHLELVEHHVTQTLIVDYSKVDVCCELFACDPRVHGFISVVVVSSC